VKVLALVIAVDRGEEQSPLMKELLVFHLDAQIHQETINVERPHDNERSDRYMAVLKDGLHKHRIQMMDYQ
jgi:hypothetical protein